MAAPPPGRGAGSSGSSGSGCSWAGPFRLERRLSDESADALWLALAGCADSQHWVSRAAAEARIA